MLFISLQVFSQAPNWEWVKRAGGSLNDIGKSVATDQYGNTYLLGIFGGPQIIFGNDTLLSSGNGNVFLVKFDINGNVTWLKNAGGVYGNFPTAVASDNFGNVFVAGIYSSSILIFGNDTLTNSYNGSSDVYLVKYDSAGNVSWAKTGGGDNSDQLNSLCTDLFGNVYITGIFDGDNMIFDTDTIINANYGAGDIFLVKYDSTGNVQWAKRFGDFYTDDATAITTDALGNLFVTGGFHSPSISFDTITVTNPNINLAEIFIVKFDTSGHAVWVRTSSGPGVDWATAITCDISGNIYITGYYDSLTVTFGSATVTNVNSNNYNIFVAKYSPSGNVLWATGAGGTSNDYPSSITTDTSNNVYVAGYFYSRTISFGSFILTNHDTSGYSDDVFIGIYNSIGTVLGVKSAGGIVSNDNDEANSICADAFGNVYVTGRFSSHVIAFNNINLTNNSVGYYDVFFGKLDSVFTVSVKEVGKINYDISIYPNPASSAITIHQSSPSPNQQLLITNILGEEIYHQAINNSSQTTIDVSHWSNGVYFYQIRRDKETLQGKFVKEN